MAKTKPVAGNSAVRGAPHNLEAEQSVLGSILIDGESGVPVFGALVEDDFYSPVHKIIYTAMRGIYERNSPVDLVTLADALTAAGKIENVGGIDYLTTLSDVVPSSANLRHYTEILKRNSTLRKLIAAGNEIVRQGYNGDDERAALAAAEKLIFDISREGERKELTALGAELPAVLERLDTIQRDPTAMRGLKTGFYGLDNITNGLQKSDLIILAARPSIGKTSLGLNMILNAALTRSAKCAVFSLEMSKQSLAARALCSVARVSLVKANKGELSAEEWRKIWAANKRLADAGVYVDDNSIITPAEILNKCMRLKREQGLDFVMIDYLGLMQSGKTGRAYEGRQNEVAENSRMMKILAKELEIPVLLLSQLNRGIESRKGTDSRPMLSDLRDSGAIEQDADLVMFLHRQREDTESSPDVDEVDLIVAKHRNGPLDTIKLRWVGEYMTFMNMSGDQAAQDAKDAVAGAKVPDNKPKTQSSGAAGKDKSKEKQKTVEQSTVPLEKSDATDVF
jgi:replicative DNA helicase